MSASVPSLDVELDRNSLPLLLLPFFAFADDANHPFSCWVGLRARYSGVRRYYTHCSIVSALCINTTLATHKVVAVEKSVVAVDMLEQLLIEHLIAPLGCILSGLDVIKLAAEPADQICA